MPYNFKMNWLASCGKTQAFNYNYFIQIRNVPFYIIEIIIVPHRETYPFLNQLPTIIKTAQSTMAIIQLPPTVPNYKFDIKKNASGHEKLCCNFQTFINHDEILKSAFQCVRVHAKEIFLVLLKHVSLQEIQKNEIL